MSRLPIVLLLVVFLLFAPCHSIRRTRKRRRMTDKVHAFSRQTASSDALPILKLVDVFPALEESAADLFMNARAETDIASVVNEFQIPGTFRCAESFGSGHINATWCATMDQDGQSARYTLQRINPRVFRDPRAVMENIQRVTLHLARKLEGLPDAHRRVLTLIPARDGRAWYEDPVGCHWRVYRFIEHARTCDVVESVEDAFQAARAFGRFQRLLSDLPSPRLHDTIPDFHHTPRRFACLEQAIETDQLNRASQVKPEIEFALKRQGTAAVLVNAGLPERVTHNDTKVNNVLLDSTTGEALCVIDLDTVMPGLALYDFGDLVRTATSPAAEDERDLSNVSLRLPLFEALLRGYWEEASAFLTSAERRHLVVSGQLITFETGLRFLTDFLQGDTYFKVHRPLQNLDRCRTQFRLVQCLEHERESMERLVEGLGRG